MKLRHRTSVTTLGAVALLLGSAVAGQADTVYNDLDGSIDSVLETMTLTFDSVNAVGSTGSTLLQMRVDGPAEGDRGGCNVQGAPQFVTIKAHSTDTNVVQLTNGPSYTFNLCTDTPTVAVKATGLDPEISSAGWFIEFGRAQRQGATAVQTEMERRSSPAGRSPSQTHGASCPRLQPNR